MRDATLKRIFSDGKSLQAISQKASGFPKTKAKYKRCFNAFLVCEFSGSGQLAEFSLEIIIEELLRVLDSEHRKICGTGLCAVGHLTDSVSIVNPAGFEKTSPLCFQ